MTASSLVENRVLESQNNDFEEKQDGAALPKTEADLQAAVSKDRLDHLVEIAKEEVISEALTDVDVSGTGKNDESLENLQKLVKELTLSLGGASLAQKAVITDNINILNDKIEKYEAISHQGIDDETKEVTRTNLTFREGEEDEEKKAGKKKYEDCSLEELQEESLALIAALMQLGAKGFQMLDEYLNDDDVAMKSKYDDLLAVNVNDPKQLHVLQDLVAVNRERDKRQGISHSKEFVNRDGQVTARVTTSLYVEGYEGEMDPNKMTQEDNNNLLNALIKAMREDPNSITLHTTGFGDKDQVEALARENARESRSSLLEQVKDRIAATLGVQDNSPYSSNMRDALAESWSVIEDGIGLSDIKLQEVGSVNATLPSAPEMPRYPVASASLARGDNTIVWADQVEEIVYHEDSHSVDVIPMAEARVINDDTPSTSISGVRAIEVLTEVRSSNQSQSQEESRVNSHLDGMSGKAGQSQGRY